jgi:hypothetical protein
MKTLLLSQPTSTSFPARISRFLTLTVFPLLLFSASGFAQLFVQKFNSVNSVYNYLAAFGSALVSAPINQLAYCQPYSHVRLSISISPPVT